MCAAVFQTVICERGAVNELINAQRLRFDRAANLELIDQPVFILLRPKNRVKDRWVKTRGSFGSERYTRAHGTCVYYVHQAVALNCSFVTGQKRKTYSTLPNINSSIFCYCFYLSRSTVGVFLRIWLNIMVPNVRTMMENKYAKKTRFDRKITEQESGRWKIFFLCVYLKWARCRKTRETIDEK